MTPTETAKEIFDKYHDTIQDYMIPFRITDSRAKACAIIHVNGIIDEYEKEIIPDAIKFDAPIWERQKESWKQVLTEINKL